MSAQSKLTTFEKYWNRKLKFDCKILYLQDKILVVGLFWEKSPFCAPFWTFSTVTLVASIRYLCTKFKLYFCYSKSNKSDTAPIQYIYWFVTICFNKRTHWFHIGSWVMTIFELFQDSHVILKNRGNMKIFLAKAYKMFTEKFL